MGRGTRGHGQGGLGQSGGLDDDRVESAPGPAVRVGRLLDGTGGPAVEGAALLVVDGRIAEVGPDDVVAQPEDARTLDLPGTTALPGLMDAHVHVTMPPTIDPLASMLAESDEDLVVRGSAAASAWSAPDHDCLRLRRARDDRVRNSRRHRARPDPGAAAVGERTAGHPDAWPLPFLRWRG